jgi:hypothetical protein
MKNFGICSSFILLSFLINFAIYNLSFNVQAAIYLSEEQRLESGLLMLKSTVPAFFIASVIIIVVFYFVFKKANKNVNADS